MGQGKDKWVQGKNTTFPRQSTTILTVPHEAHDTNVLLAKFPYHVRRTGEFHDHPNAFFPGDLPQEQVLK